MKLCVLVGQRCQTLRALQIAPGTGMDLCGTRCTFTVNNLLKQSRRGTHLAPIELYKCKNKALCVIHTLNVYLYKAKPLLGNPTVIITLLAPHKGATTNTTAQWLKWTLARTNIVTVAYTTHSTWSASSSAVKSMAMSVDTIMKAARWTNAVTLENFYHKQIIDKASGSASIGQTVLNSFLLQKLCTHACAWLNRLSMFWPVGVPFAVTIAFNSHEHRSDGLQEMSTNFKQLASLTS